MLLSNFIKCMAWYKTRANLNWPYLISSFRLHTKLNWQSKICEDMNKPRKKKDSNIHFIEQHTENLDWFYWCAKNEYWINSIDNRPPKTYLAFRNDHWFRSRYFHPCGVSLCTYTRSNLIKTNQSTLTTFKNTISYLWVLQRRQRFFYLDSCFNIKVDRVMELWNYFKHVSYIVT